MTAPTKAPAPAASSPFGWSLAALLREWTARVTDSCDELPQGSRGYQVLSVVVHDAPPTQAALAAHLGIDRTVMTYLLDELVTAGLVERQQDPADRRARRIVATARGAALVAELDARVAAAEDDLLSGLSARERDTLRGLLERAAVAAAPGDDRCAVVATAVDASQA